MVQTYSRLYMGKKRSNEYAIYSRDFFREEPLDVAVVKNGIILPAHENKTKLWADGGVIDENGNFLETTKIAKGFTFGGKYAYDKDKIIKLDEVVLYFNPLIKHWGHFICDLIGRLWYIRNNPRKYKIAYCGWNWGLDEGGFSGNFLELLGLLGIKKEQLINVQHPMQFKKVIVPDSAFVQNEYYATEFTEMIDILVKNALKKCPSVPEKIYFSRTRLGFDKELGEAKLEKLFADNGYEIMYPEKLSVKEQICYFNKAKSIVMVAGSISHNLIFTRSSKVDAAIINKMPLPNSYQFTVDSMTKANVSYVDAYFAPRPVLYGMGPFLLSINRYLRQFLHDKELCLTVSSSTPIRDYIWYFKKYYEYYNNDDNKKALKNQMLSLSRQADYLRKQKNN